MTDEVSQTTFVGVTVRCQASFLNECACSTYLSPKATRLSKYGTQEAAVTEKKPALAASRARACNCMINCFERQTGQTGVD